MIGRPRRIDREPPRHRLKQVRQRLGVSVKELAQRTGWDDAKVYRLEAGETAMSVEELLLAATSLGISAEQLLPQGDDRFVAIVGYVGAGAVVYPIDDDTAGVAPLSEVECPAELDPTNAEAYWVQGDSMLPVEPGSILFISGPHLGNPVGHLCLADLADGRRLFKYVRPAPNPGRFNLWSSNAPLIEDAQVKRFARVRHILAPKARR